MTRFFLKQSHFSPVCFDFRLLQSQYTFTLLFQIGLTFQRKSWWCLAFRFQKSCRLIFTIQMCLSIWKNSAVTTTSPPSYRYYRLILIFDIQQFLECTYILVYIENNYSCYNHKNIVIDLFPKANYHMLPVQQTNSPYIIALYSHAELLIRASKTKCGQFLQCWK